LLCLTWLAGCTKEAPKPAEESRAATGAPAEAAPSSRADPSPVSQPVDTTASPGAPAPGSAAAEKHRLQITNYAKTPLSVTLNQEWVGQWDDHITVPLEQVLQGKNALTVELAAQPDNELKLEVQADRGGQWVSLLSLNFKGKSGSQNIAFVAR
jgi:hypothetical protein